MKKNMIQQNDKSCKLLEIDITTDWKVYAARVLFSPSGGTWGLIIQGIDLKYAHLGKFDSIL